MQATSIHIRPVARGSEAHNERKKELPHIREELTPQNESWKDASFPSIDEEMEAIRADYQAAHGKKLHAKATPIREAVVVIRPDTTIDQLREACRICQERWGIRAMQIHTHKDEGHGEGDAWKPNLHAHIVFCWYDFEKHNTCKLNREDMAEMQTVFADTLKMARGQSSDRQHLSALQYKTAAEEKRLKELEQRKAFEARSIDAILAGQEQALRERVRELQEAGERAVKTFDWLTQPTFAAAVPAKQKEKEIRERLEQETRKDTAALSSKELDRESVVLNNLLVHLQAAIYRIGHALQKLAKQIPFFKRSRLAHEAELVAEVERAHLDAKNASEAANLAVDKANEREEAAWRAEKAAKQREEQAAEKLRTLANEKEAARAQGYRAGVASTEPAIKERDQLRKEKEGWQKEREAWLADFKKLARILTSAYPEYVAAMEQKGVHKYIGENLWQEAKREHAKEEARQKPHLGPRR